MQALTLLFLRVSLAGLMLSWGANKLINTNGSVAISEKFYLPFMSAELLILCFGALQLFLGGLVLLGYLRRYAYPMQALINGVSFIAVFPSIIDPLGLYLSGTNLLFYPSVTIFAGSLLLMAFPAFDRYSLDAVRQRPATTWKAGNRCPRDSATL
ncbi:DoxX family membrane protein [Vreelandella venusta]